MRLKKHKGGTSVGPHAWENDGDIVDVPDELARDLLAIDGNDYEQIGADDEPEGNREFSEVVPVGYVREEEAPSTPSDRGEFPDRKWDRTAYREGEDGPETVPPEPPAHGEHPRVEAPGENRTGAKEVDRADVPGEDPTGDEAGERPGLAAERDRQRPGAEPSQAGGFENEDHARAEKNEKEGERGDAKATRKSRAKGRDDEGAHGLI